MTAPWPYFPDDEVDAAASVLRSGKVNYWTGQEGRDFEKEFATYTGVPHAIAVANGTLALDLALVGLGIGPGDEVIVSPRSFIASVSTVISAGAKPVFADVDADSGNLTAQSIAPMVNERTKAVIVVHLAGWPADIPALVEMGDAHGFKVIEDCAQAHGAKWDGQPVGSMGAVGCFSFCQDKIMTTGGEGGMVTCRDDAMWRKMWAFKDHGKSWEAVYERDHPPGFRWLHESFGTNWRLTEMQSAIGRLQLAKLDHWIETRRRNADILDNALVPFAKRGSLRLPTVPPQAWHARYKYYGYVDPAKLKDGWDRDRIAGAIAARGVPCMQGSCSEIYKERAFDGTGLRPEVGMENARRLGETSLMWLVHPTIDRAEMEKAAAISAEIFAEASA